MNIDTLAGEATETKGRFKSSLGDAMDDPALRHDGAVDQLSGNMRKGIGGLRDFAKRQPLAAAAVAGLFGLALVRTLRGRGAKV